MRIENEIQLDFDDVLISPKRSTLKTRKPKELGGIIDLEREFIFRHTKKTWKGFPVIAANMLTGSFAMARVLAEHKMLTALHKHHSAEDLVDFWINENAIAQNNTFYTLGITENDYNKYKNICVQLGFKPTMICIDVANGHMEYFVDFIKRFRDENPESVIMAGNVVTGSATEELILAGADIVKVGIGGGQNCLTRKVAGVGRPQLSAVIETADSAHGLKGMVVSDGGCSIAAHINTAFCAGSDFVMLGSMLSGTDECEGEIVEKDGLKYKKFFGMSSNSAMEKFNGGKSSYKASEGRTTMIPLRGPVNNIVEEIKGAASSCMSYIGAEKLKELPKRATFYRVGNRLNSAYEKYTVGN